MDEQPKHRMAFLTYREAILAGMGIEQAVQRVASTYKMNRATVYQWKKKFDWDERVNNAIDEIDRENLDKTQEVFKKLRESLVAAVTVPLQEYMDSISSGARPVKIKNVTDLERIAKLILLLNGDYTERKKVDTDASIWDARFDEYRQIEEYITEIEETSIDEGDTEEDGPEMGEDRIRANNTQE